jgi:hypothetical protein
MSNTPANTSVNAVTPGKLPLSRVIMAGIVAIVGSVLANLVVYWVGRMVAQPLPDFQPLASPLPTILFTTGFLVIATIVYAVINAFTSNPVRVFTIVAIVALIVGLIPDIMMIVDPASSIMGTPTLSAVLVLIVMHFVAFAITMWSFTMWAHQR